MVNVIDEGYSFGNEMGKSLGGLTGKTATAFMEQFARNKQQKAENEALKRLTGKDLSGLSPDLKKQFSQSLSKHPSHEKIVQALTSRGVPEEDAELYAMLTTGGQTEYIKQLLEGEKRSSKVDESFDQADIESVESEPQDNPEKKTQNDLAKYLKSQDEGLLPKERIKRETERYDTGLKRYEEAGTKLRGLSRDKERIGILEGLEKSGKLPKNLGRLNVAKDGSLKFPFASSPEAQQFVKTINEFSQNAKDTYGSRVTNFDLQQYMRRFPNLLNSKEGRQRILDQMKIVNQINSIYYKNIKNVYDKAGGVRKIDADAAERFAEQMSEGKINELVQKFDQIGTFPSLPSATEFKGKRIQNEDTGEIMVSDGQNWSPAGA